MQPRKHINKQDIHIPTGPQIPTIPAIPDLLIAVPSLKQVESNKLEFYLKLTPAEVDDLSEKDYIEYRRVVQFYRLAILEAEEEINNHVTQATNPKPAESSSSPSHPTLISTSTTTHTSPELHPLQASQTVSPIFLRPITDEWGRVTPEPIQASGRSTFQDPFEGSREQLSEFTTIPQYLNKHPESSHTKPHPYSLANKAYLHLIPQAISRFFRHIIGAF